MMMARVYFLRYDAQRNVVTLAPSPRRISESAPLTEQVSQAVSQLLEGPSEDDHVRGCTSEIPAGTRLLGVDLADKTAFLNFSGKIEAGGGSSSMLARVYQIVYTATDLPGIEAVRILIDGIARDAMGGEGVLIDEPVRRKEIEPEF